MASTVPVWTVQAIAAHDAALTMGAYRASPKHLENGDFCNPEAYEFMVTELEKRVGPCPTDVQESWIERGGAGTPKPVWVWLQPPYVPAAARCGQRNILVEAAVRREDVLGSQFQAYDHVLNDFPLAISEAEDDELDALKTSAPETWMQRKIDSWQRIFEVDWQGETYSLARGDEATLQGVLWQLPLSCARRTRRMLELGRTIGAEVPRPAEIPSRLNSSWPMLSCSARIFRPHGLVWKGMSLGRWMASAPAWWAKGWPRERVDSLAEAELLSQLAVALKPRTKIGEVFRRFPAPEGWCGKYLDPDLAVHGVLKRNGALFVEYDGYWRHSEGERLSTDLRKNAALLSYAPASSRIVRIGHWERNPTEAHPRILWITVDQWNAGSQKSISKILKTILLQILTEFDGCLQPHVSVRLQKLAQMEFMPASTGARDFCTAAAAAAGRCTKEELFDVLTSHGFACSSIKRLTENSHLLKFSSERQIRPGVNWLFNLGLSDYQVAKALSLSPQILGLSIENNLQPTVRWFRDLGLTQSQVAKAVTAFPQILSYSLEQNLKLTLQWFLDLGLTKSQVAKAAATSPQILGLSIEQNLKPTVQWLLDLGLTKSQVAKAVTAVPQILGYSLEQNLKLTLQWFLDLGLTKSQVAKAAATSPKILGLSIEQNLKPTVQWLLDLGLTKSQVAKAVDHYPPILWLSIEQNLQPTVRWFLDLGLSKIDIAKMVASSPRMLGFSVSGNLSHKVSMLHTFFSPELTTALIRRWPQILGYSSRRLSKRLSILSERNETHRILYAITLSEAAFQRRFLDRAVEVDYPADGLSVGEDVEMTAVWIFSQATLPPLHLRLHVVAVADGGAAATAGVGKGWTVTCLLSPVEDEEPLPSLPLQRGVSTGVRNFVRPKRAPPAAAQLLATLRQLRGVQLVFQAPEEEPDSDDELYDETQEIPETLGVGGGDLSYDDEVELVDEAGNYLQQLRPQMGGRNRMRNVGLHTIESGISRDFLHRW
ncbi:unnamed protein product [Cladocopium goreaui]|uniref:Heat shock protein 90 n=1 Tax=Cladocopium goreaui TaxID=2562237 RepID=A0A9P1DMN5_9DINO|nr:unnamed protein product [Cladocopium goreaui]